MSQFATPTSTGFLLGLLFDPEDGGGMLLRNVGLSPNFMALQHTRRQQIRSCPVMSQQRERGQAPSMSNFTTPEASHFCRSVSYCTLQRVMDPRTKEECSTVQAAHLLCNDCAHTAVAMAELTQLLYQLTLPKQEEK
jgi:hypothetical protein